MEYHREQTLWWTDTDLPTPRLRRTDNDKCMMPAISELRFASLATLAIILMASRRNPGSNAEQFAQLLIGILCACALLYFSYIELLNPDLVVSDRLFWTLVSLIVASVGLREFQYRYGGQSPPGRSTDNDQDTDKTDRRDRRGR